MLIRTQDREMLVNLSSLTMIGYNSRDKSIDGIFNNGEQCILGVYKSKKRCKEVLDMVQDSYGIYLCDGIVMNDWHYVFEMPEE